MRGRRCHQSCCAGRVCEKRRARCGLVQGSWNKTADRLRSLRCVQWSWFTCYTEACLGVLVHSSREVRLRLNAFEHDVKAERVYPNVVYPPTPPMTEDSASQYSEDSPSRDALGVTTISPELHLEGMGGKDGLRSRGSGALGPHITPSVSHSDCFLSTQPRACSRLSQSATGFSSSRKGDNGVGRE